MNIFVETFRIALPMLQDVDAAFFNRYISGVIDEDIFGFLALKRRHLDDYWQILYSRGKLYLRANHKAKTASEIYVQSSF